MFGQNVSTAGDVNGDGYNDVIVGVPGYQGNKGKVCEYLGSANGLISSPSWTASGEYTGDEFGSSVSTAGDVNGDGYLDVIIGAPGVHNAGGKVYIYYGSSGGLSASPSWTHSGDNENDHFGASVSSAGDVNGDGYSDVIIGAPGFSSHKGKVYLYYGSPSGLPSTPNWTKTGENNGDLFGCSVVGWMTISINNFFLPKEFNSI